MSPSSPLPFVITARRVALLRQRKERFAKAVYFFTGNPTIPSHPYLRSPRFAWDSKAAPGTLLANS